MGFSSVVVHDLYFSRTLVGPFETDSVLIVQSDGVLPRSIAFELLEAEAWKRE